MAHAIVRHIALLSIAAALGCAPARTAEAPTASLQEAPSMHTVTVSREQPAHIAAASLSIELIAVKDDRCPERVNCIWAGHAAITLKVSKSGAATKSITLGTAAPPPMGLPYDAVYEGYRFHLVKLQPGNSGAADARYRATVQVSSASPGDAAETQALDR